MNLSKDSIRLLHWLYKHDKWYYIEEIESLNDAYEYRSFAALKEAGFVDCEVFDYDYEYPEYDEDDNECFRESYRISAAGKSYLENIPTRIWPEIRAWIAICISAIALIVSIITLLK